MTREKGDEIRTNMRRRLAIALRIPESELTPQAMVRFFERCVPLGQQKGLTYFAMLISMMWECLERQDHKRLEGLVALSAVYVEQTALEGGKHQLGWLLTGLDQPMFNLTTQNTTRNQAEPFGQLLDPSWMQANLAYLKDLDYFNNRQAAVGRSTTSEGPVTADPKPKAKGKPRRGAGRGKPQENAP